MPSVNNQQILQNASQNLQNQAKKAHGKEGELGKQDFMNLFMTQMSNQNPVDPMDSGAMMQQMAQLGSMEQLQNINEGLQTLNKTQSQNASMQALGYLNKDVLLEASGLELDRGQPKSVYYDLPKEAQHMRVFVEASDGSPVLKQDLGMVQPGKHQFVWDGKDDAGRMMADGNYKIRMIASYADGTSSELMAYNAARVEGVDFRNGQAMIRAKGELVPISKIASVDTASAFLREAKPLPLARGYGQMGLSR